jgi:hypothetical protein
MKHMQGPLGKLETESLRVHSYYWSVIELEASGSGLLVLV